MPRHPQPVPPIYQPEVIAEAVMHVLRHPSREMWIGWSTVKAIVGQKLIPGWLDRYLAKEAYDGQQTDEPRPDRPDNVDTPIPGDRGAHGRFDERARSTSAQFWLRQHGLALVGSVAAASLVFVGVKAALK